MEHEVLILKGLIATPTYPSNPLPQTLHTSQCYYNFGNNGLLEGLLCRLSICSCMCTVAQLLLSKHGTATKN